MDDKAEPKTALIKYYHCVSKNHGWDFMFLFLQKQVEFLVEYADTEKAASKPVNFNVTPETLQNIREVSASSHFRTFVRCKYVLRTYSVSWESIRFDENPDQFSSGMEETIV